jgi:ribosomal protein S18 acetylase RimI-like enzyme
MLPQAAMPVPYPRDRAAGRASRWLRPFFAWAMRRSAAYVYELEDLAARPAGHETALAQGYGFRQVNWEELDACAAVAGAPAEEYRRRWEQGGECYAAFWQGRPAHLGWLHFGSVYVRGLGLLIEADPSVCYLYNVVTDPDHRRRGLYKCTQRTVTAMLAARGIRRVTQVVMMSNTVPQITLPQLGYRLAQVVRHTSLCGWKFTVVRDAAGKTISRRLFCRAPKSVFLI